MNPPPARLRPDASRLVAYMLAFLLSVLLPLALIGFQTGWVLFDRDRMAGMLSQAAEESGLLDEGLAWFSKSQAARYAAAQAGGSGGSGPDILAILENIPPAGWNGIRKALLSEPIVTGWSSQTVDAVLDWVDGGERLPQVAWDMAPLRARLLSQAGQSAIAIGFASLPPCSQAQIEAFEARLRAALPGQDVHFEACQHPPPWYLDQLGAYLAAMNQIASQIEDTFDLTPALQSAQNPAGVGAWRLKGGLRLLRWGMVLAPLFFIGTLIAIRLLTGGSRYEIGKTIGVSLSFAGGSALMLASAYPPLIESYVRQFVLSEVPRLLHPPASAAIQRISQQIFPAVAVEGMLILAGGVLVMLWGAGIFGRKPAKP